jgi:hypothetical protein
MNFPKLLILTAFILCVGIVSLTSAQPPEPAPTLPPGMKGSDTSDPRTKLAPGLFNAGEAIVGLKHLALLKKPESFQVGSDPDSDKVKNALRGFGVRADDVAKIPGPQRLGFVEFAFANTDIAFQDNYLFMGNYYGVNIYDISMPSASKLVTSMVCPGGQGDVSVYKNLMFMSVEAANGRLDCGVQGFEPNPPPPAGERPTWKPPAADKDRFRGVRIFDISDIRSPKQVGAVQSCRGSHTHTLVVDPKDKENVYIYISGTSFVRQEEELPGCSEGPPDKDPNTALFRIEVVKVPVAAPQNAKIVSNPRVFMDPRSGVINSLLSGATHGKDKPMPSDQCHDITVYSEIGLAAGACDGNGIVLDIKDPVNPKRLDAVNDPNYAYWHSASFSNDGKKVMFTDEWGGGGGARCRANDPNVWGANALFNLKDGKLSFANYYKLPAAQSDTENCVAHNGSLIPVPGRDVFVQSWYQGGISIMDFTDAAKPMEIAYFDRGPIDPNTLVLGGHWSAYWYNGNIYGSEIVRGLDILELTATKYLSQNEIDAAKSVKVAEMNVQNQEKIVWPNTLVVAKAYLDQLERSQGLPAGKITSLRNAIQKAEGSSSEAAKLKKHAKQLEKSAASANSMSDANRLRGLAAIMKSPAV